MVKQLKIVFGIIVPLLTVFVIIYAFQAYLDNRVKDIINDEDFIGKVASNVRPYVIFDEKGSVLMDGGGMQYLQKPPEIIPCDKGFRVIVTPKEHLHTAPIVESLNLTQYAIFYTRGSGYVWICHLYRAAKFTEDDFADISADEAGNRFRLEIVK